MGAIAVIASCSSPNPLDGSRNNGNQPGGNACASPNDGCACSQPGQVVECGEVIRRSGDSVQCSMGHRQCTDGKWGACIGDRIAFQSVGSLDINGLHTEGVPGPCLDNPCNPNCYTFDGDGGVVVPDAAGLSMADGGGITITGNSCSGLACQVVQCDGGLQTTIQGVVTDPAGQRPINKAFVYVPNGPLTPFPPGVQADPCGGGGTLSGNPIAVAQTAPNGTFTLKNVPAGANIPLVIQVGMWRRTVTIPNVPACQNTIANQVLGSVGALHLPSNQSEGDMPLMGLITGGCDMFECLLKRIGINASGGPNNTGEFTAPGGGGKVEMYQGIGGYPLAPPQGSPFMDQFFSSQANVNRYNIVMLPCDCGSEYYAGSYGAVPYYTAQNMLVSYSGAGGRFFTSHWGRNWIERPNNLNVSPFPGVANWGGTPIYGYAWALWGYVDTGFQKGQDFNAWLASPLVGVGNPFYINPSRYDVASVNAPTERWVYARSDNAGPQNPDVVVNMAFNTPLGGMNQFGRVAYSDTHVSSQDGYWPLQFPSICNPSNAMTPQEEALEYMFFDLSACNKPIMIVPFPNPVSFDVDYQAQCPMGKKVVWRFFDWKAVTPLDSNISFTAATADTQPALTAATAIGIGTASVALNTANATPPPPLNWIGTDVSTKLALIPTVSKGWLRVHMTLAPASNGMQAPTLSGWRQAYDCVDNL